MNEGNKYLAALITALCGIGCIYYFMVVEYKDDNYRILAGAFVMFIEVLILALAGVIFFNFKKTRSVGQGILIGTLVTLVIGFGICSSV